MVSSYYKIYSWKLLIKLIKTHRILNLHIYCLHNNYNYWYNSWIQHQDNTIRKRWTIFYIIYLCTSWSFNDDLILHSNNENGKLEQTITTCHATSCHDSEQWVNKSFLFGTCWVWLNFGGFCRRFWGWGFQGREVSLRRHPSVTGHQSVAASSVSLSSLPGLTLPVAGTSRTDQQPVKGYIKVSA